MSGPGVTDLRAKGQQDAQKIRAGERDPSWDPQRESVRRRASLGARAAWWLWLTRKSRSIPRTFLRFLSFGSRGKPQGISGLSGAALSREQSRRAKKGMAKRQRDARGRLRGAS